jgi:hypothetical protein
MARRDIDFSEVENTVVEFRQRLAVTFQPRPWQQPWSLADGESLDGFNHGRGSKSLYIVGCVYYTDLDGQCHRSDVCLTWQPGNTREPYPLCKEKHRNDVE